MLCGGSCYLPFLPVTVGGVSRLTLPFDQLRVNALRSDTTCRAQQTNEALLFAAER